MLRLTIRGVLWFYTYIFSLPVEPQLLSSPWPRQQQTISTKFDPFFPRLPTAFSVSTCHTIFPLGVPFIPHSPPSSLVTWHRPPELSGNFASHGSHLGFPRRSSIRFFPHTYKSSSLLVFPLSFGQNSHLLAQQHNSNLLTNSKPKQPCPLSTLLTA